MDSNQRLKSKLETDKIIKIIWHFIIETKSAKVAELLDLEPNTVHDWYSYCREICDTLNQRHWVAVKLGDGNGELADNALPHSVVQIDKSLLRGRRKYNHRRLLQGTFKLKNKLI